MTGSAAVLAGSIGLVAGYLIHVAQSRAGARHSAARVQRLIEDAERDARSLKREAEVQIKADAIRAREIVEASTEASRSEQQVLTARLLEREANVDRRVTSLERKEAALDARTQEVDAREREAALVQADLERTLAEERVQLERVAGMTAAEAQQALLERVETDVRRDMGGLIRRVQEDARVSADREASRIVVQAIQRYAGSHASETMTSTVALPSAEMKGRVIGREGRNIRALEACTGVNVLIDDVPDAVVLASFDPIRREIARLALEQLVADGRIHPARIEEVVARVEQNVEETGRRAGEEAAYQLGIQGLDVELQRQLGRLRHRTSYSQNVLQHSIEVAHFMGMMAAELGLDVATARRVGLFHDIGKALTHEVEGGHAAIGADLLRRCGEAEAVISGVAGHHHDVDAMNPYAVLASAADAISGSRPGARVESTEIYLKRLERLESIARGHEGVVKCYAIHAGREVRVLVDPAQIEENAAVVLARNISRQIEGELKYPGQIRVVVIRETRCVEYAR